MRRDRLSALAAFDEATELVTRELPGGAGLAVLAALPLRFLEVHFLNRVSELGKHAGDYGRYLLAISVAITLASALAFWGRAVLAHAVVRALTGDAGDRQTFRQALKLRPGALAAGFYAFLFAQVLLLAFAFTVAGAAAAVLLSGLAAATVHLQERVGPIAPLATVFGQVRPFRVYAGLLLLAGVAFVVAYVNLGALFALGLWAAKGVPGVELARWQALFSIENRHFLLLLGAGAALAVEPFWIAALAVAVHRARARQSGEDLRGWFEEIVAERAAAGSLAGHEGRFAAYPGGVRSSPDQASEEDRSRGEDSVQPRDALPGPERDLRQLSHVSSAASR